MKDFGKDITINEAYELVNALQDAVMACKDSHIPVVIEDENGRIEHICHIWLDKERGMLRLSVAGVVFIDHEEEEEEIKIEPERLKYQFCDVRCDYFDPEEKLWYIDAWRTDDGNEEGEVVAKVNPETCAVHFTKDKYRLDIRVQETITDVLKCILQGAM